MAEYEWYFAAASFNARSKKVTVYQEPMVEYPTIDDQGVAQGKVAFKPAALDRMLHELATWPFSTPVFAA